MGISKIGGLKDLQKDLAFLVSTAELLRTRVLTRLDDDSVNTQEWLALDRIPASCVIADKTTKQFLQCCDSSKSSSLF